MKLEYISLIISFIAALAWIPSLIQLLRCPKYILTARLKDTLKLKRFQRFMDGKDRIGFVLVIAVDFWIEQPQGEAYNISEFNVDVKFKDDKCSYNTLYLNKLEYTQITGMPEPVKMHLVYSDGTNIRDSPNISWNQSNLRLLPLFIPADTERYSGKYETIEWIKISMTSGKGVKQVVDVKLDKELQENGLIMKHIEPVGERDNSASSIMR